MGKRDNAPWKAVRVGETSDGRDIFTVYDSTGTPVVGALFKAEAELISAGPQLLQVAREALITLHSHCKSIDGADTAEAIERTKANLSAVIAKAGG